MALPVSIQIISKMYLNAYCNYEIELLIKVEGGMTWYVINYTLKTKIGTESVLTWEIQSIKLTKIFIKI